MEKEDILQRAALILRHEIREIEHRPLPDQLKIVDLINGEFALPTSLTRFYETLLTRSSSNNKRISESFSADLIYPQ